MDTDKGGGLAFASGATAKDERRGRFITGDDLTPKQKAFVSAYVSNGGNATQAATAAGYTSPRTDAWRLCKNVAIAQAIRERQMAEMASLAQVALGSLRDLMTDETVPPATRFAAVKFTLEAAGHGLAAHALAVRAGGGVSDDRPLSEYSVSELELLIAAKEVETKALRPDSAPVVEVEVAQVVDSQAVAVSV